MKPIVYTCIKRWRENNPQRFKEQCRQYAQKNSIWKSIANEFRKILITDHIEDYVDGRGRPRKPKPPSQLTKRGRPKKTLGI
jgi:hypothetical protein